MHANRIKCMCAPLALAGLLISIGQWTAGGASVHVASSVPSSAGYQMHTPVVNDVQECTDFKSGSYALGPGESATGCVTFELPTGVPVAKVKWDTKAGVSPSDDESVNP